MKLPLRFLLAASLLLLLAGCGGVPVEEPKPDRSFVFGYLDLEDGPGKLVGVWIHQIAPVDPEGGYWSFWTEDGAFFNPHLPVGSFNVDEFRSQGFNSVTRMKVPRQMRELQFKVNKSAGFYFVGSFKYVPVETGFFERGKFSLKKVNEPSEKQVLTMILPRLEGLKLHQRALDYMKGLK